MVANGAISSLFYALFMGLVLSEILAEGYGFWGFVGPCGWDCFVCFAG